MDAYFNPLAVGDLRLPNRIVMSPLTRMRAVEARTPNTLMREYYVQRAAAGLIISEATSVEPMGVGYPNTPGIWSEAQVAGWKVITDAVHAAGGRMVLQLWHVGRISDPLYLDGALPVAPSAIAPEGHVATIRPIKPYVTPRALETEEVPAIVENFARGARLAKQAGFDGVEIHAANGYLIDQFLQDGANKRTDRYGGSIENRARLLLEVTDKVVAEWGVGRVGVHLNLRMDSHSMGDSDPAALFGHVASELSRRKIAFIFARESLVAPRLSPIVRKAFDGVLIANDSITPAEGANLIANGEADAVSFGRLYIANPDLVQRIRTGAPLNELNKATIYGSDGTGYTDYPTLAA